MPQTPHVTRKLAQQPAASTAAARINIQSQEPSSRDPHEGSNPTRFQGGAIRNLLRTLPKTTLNAQSASTLDAPMQEEKERLEFDKFPNPSTFAVWKMSFRSEDCSVSCHRSYAMIRISEF